MYIYILWCIYLYTLYIIYIINNIIYYKYYIYTHQWQFQCNQQWSQLRVFPRQFQMGPHIYHIWVMPQLWLNSCGDNPRRCVAAKSPLIISGGLWTWGGHDKKILQHIHRSFDYPICSMVLVYLPTKLGD